MCGRVLYTAGEVDALLTPIARAVSAWRSVAASFGISKAQQNDMADAFEHADGYSSILCH